VLPIEDPAVFNSAIGIYGFNQYVDTRARFTGDGLTAYLVTATATGDNNTSKSFVYSLNAALGSAPPPQQPPPTSTLLRSTSITLSAKLLRSRQVSVAGVVTVKGSTGAAVPGATVMVTWNGPNGTVHTQTAATGTTGNANFSITGDRGTYTLTVTSLAKSGFTFDPANSVLTRSITK